MSDDPVGRESDTEREWRETVERYTSAADDCTQFSAGLAASRSAFDERKVGRPNRGKLAVGGLVLLAVPLIVYSELTTPTGAINYGGLGIGLVLMIIGGLS